MIGPYLSVPQFLLLAFFAFAFMGLVIVLIATRPTQKELTVEAEDDLLRETAAFSAQHNPGVTVGDADNEEFLLDSLDERDAWLSRHGIGKGSTA